MNEVETDKALPWGVLLLALASGVVLLPFGPPLLLAAWVAEICSPLHRRLAKPLRSRRVAAACVVALLTLALLVPLAATAAWVYESAIPLARRLAQSSSVGAALKQLAQGTDSTGAGAPQSLEQLQELVGRHAERALSAARSLLSVATTSVVNAVVFAAALHVFLADGEKLRQWLLEHSPLSRGHHHRFENAFSEVGRGLLVGIGLTALAQGLVATVGYVAVGLPEALVLGLFTSLASLIPSVGSSLVWLPVTAGLWLGGRHGAAAALLAVGLVVSVVDNALRPLFARYAKLRMNGLLLFIAMLGGLVVLGGWGLLLGPLFVRCAVEGLEMLRSDSEH